MLAEVKKSKLCLILIFASQIPDTRAESRTNSSLLDANEQMSQTLDRKGALTRWHGVVGPILVDDSLILSLIRIRYKRQTF